jgi:hypothetical protein
VVLLAAAGLGPGRYATRCDCLSAAKSAIVLQHHIETLPTLEWRAQHGKKNEEHREGPKRSRKVDGLE